MHTVLPAHCLDHCVQGGYESQKTAEAPAADDFRDTGREYVLIAFAPLICFAGSMLGGASNALISDNGFLVPKKETGSGGQVIWRPGIIGNIPIGLLGGLPVRVRSGPWRLQRTRLGAGGCR